MHWSFSANMSRYQLARLGSENGRSELIVVTVALPPPPADDRWLGQATYASQPSKPEYTIAFSRHTRMRR